tara:strand:+ start:157 stop:546 length:390 start_codon:yes stop_codon:yes gene_type:complete
MTTNIAPILAIMLTVPGIAYRSAFVYADELSEVKRIAPKYNARAEVRLKDGTRCDLLNDIWAIEADWPEKWAEAIGQAGHYANQTGKLPAVMLLVRDYEKEKRHIDRCARVCNRFGINLFLEPVLPRGP